MQRSKGALQQTLPLPRCAFYGVPARYEIGKKDAIALNQRLNIEELSRLDFHGFSGDIEGLQAFLAHKFGCSARGWRTAIAPDKAGLLPATFSEFIAGLREIGYSGQALTLWKEISDRSSGTLAAFEDFDAGLAELLDKMSECIMHSGGVEKMWQAIHRNHSLRVTLPEFAAFWIQTKPGIVSRTGLRRVFEALDMDGRGSLTFEDLHFLELWANRNTTQTRRNVDSSLPDSLKGLRELPEQLSWSPPSPRIRNSQAQSLQAFMKHLELRFGSLARAWRVVLDPKGCGAVSLADFGKGCRAAGWLQAHGLLWRELAKRSSTGLVTLRTLDPDTAKALDNFKDAIKKRSFCDDVEGFWGKHLDANNVGAVDLSQFMTAAKEVLGLSAGVARLVFTALDFANSKWITVSELLFVEAFESGLSMLTQESEGQKLQKRSFSASAPALPGFDDTEGPISTGVLGKFELPWDDGRLDQKLMSTVSSGANALRSMNVSVRDHLPRSRLFNLCFTSHGIKQRFLSQTLMERSLRIKDGSQTSKGPWQTPERDIFHISHEFYRAGLRKIKGEDSVGKEE